MEELPILTYSLQQLPPPVYLHPIVAQFYSYRPHPVVTPPPMTSQEVTRAGLTVKLIHVSSINYLILILILLILILILIILILLILILILLILIPDSCELLKYLLASNVGWSPSIWSNGGVGLHYTMDNMALCYTTLHYTTLHYMPNHH